MSLDHYVIAECVVCHEKFHYYRQERKVWTCSDACEVKRKDNARNAVRRVSHDRDRGDKATCTSRGPLNDKNGVQPMWGGENDKG